MRPIPITNHDHTAEELEQLARNCKDPRWARRLRAVAMVMRGARRGEAAEAHGVDVQTLRDWIELYNCEGPEGLRMPPGGGRPCRLGASQLEQLCKRVEAGPPPEADAPSRFRLCDIRNWILDVFGERYSLEGVRKLLRRLASGTCRRVPCTPRPTLRRRTISATTSASWQRTPRATQRDRSRSGSRTRAASASRECSPGSGHARALDPASPAIGASGIATSSRPLARLANWPWDTSANE